MMVHQWKRSLFLRDSTPFGQDGTPVGRIANGITAPRCRTARVLFNIVTLPHLELMCAVPQESQKPRIKGARCLLLL